RGETPQLRAAPPAAMVGCSSKNHRGRQQRSGADGTLVLPLKNGDKTLEHAYERALLGTELRLLPITHAILREAARLRATTRIKTPDALYAATAMNAGCVLFVTNDAGFRSVVGLPLVILSDLLTP